MKLGLMTDRFAEKYGAVLQAYALQTYLQKAEHTAEFIDYRPDYMVTGGRLALPWSRGLFIGLARGLFLSRLFTSLQDPSVPAEVRAYQRHERAIGCALAALAFAVYAWTLCPGFFPGASAASCAGLLQAQPSDAVIGHPYWALAARLAMLLPIGELPFRLNLFSALCGAAAVAWVFRLTTLLLYEALREHMWSAVITTDDDPPGAMQPQAAGNNDWIQTDAAHHRQALAGGAVAALAFAFCAPLWSASVSLHAQTFDLLLLLLTATLLAKHLLLGQPFYLVAGTFLCGIGLVESVAFAVLLPVFLGIFFCTGARQNQLSASFGLLLISLGSGLLCAAVLLVVGSVCGGAALSSATSLQVIAELGRSHAHALLAGLSRSGWLPALSQGFVPVLTLYLGARSLFDKRDTQASWSWCAVCAMFAALAALALLNLPGSCWQLAREGDSLPLVPLLGTAMACGALFVFGLQQSRKPDVDESDDEAPSGTLLLRGAGTLLSAAVALLVLVAPFRNIKDADGRLGAFADAFCREVLAASPQASCFVTDGLFDANLLVQARLAKRNVILLTDRVIPPSGAAQGKGAPPTAAPTALDEGKESLRLNSDEADQIALLTSSALWREAGYQPVPDRLAYRAGKLQESIDPSALLKQHRAFWQRIEPLLASGPELAPSLRRYHQAMRMQVSRVANDLGVLCLSKEAMKEAEEAFCRARAIDADNLSAFLNQYALYFEHPEIGRVQELQARMTAFAVRSPTVDALASCEASYGALYLPGVEHLSGHTFVEQALSQSGQRQSPLMAQLSEHCRVALLSEGALRPAPQTAVPSAPDNTLARAKWAFLNGRRSDAEMWLRVLIQTRRDRLPVYALLAEVLLSKGALGEVRSEILPAMRVASSSGESRALIDLTEGRLAMCGKPSDYAAARACFTRALLCNPDSEESQAQLLQASLALNDTRQIESDCLALLAHTPAQPAAHAALGRLYLSQGRYQEAEKSLNASVAVRSTAPALSDLAVALYQLRKLDAAEKAACRALLLDPALVSAWDALKRVLSAAGALKTVASARLNAQS
jgi:tetratricopeptide (TPR) repeat protein